MIRIKTKNIILSIVIILIVASIYYFESTKPEVDNSYINSDIEIIVNDSNQTTISLEAQNRIEEKSEKYEVAKEIIGPEGFVNIDNITITEHIGKNVILVDFWTYSCINCQRTFPYLNAWHDKYNESGLVIIGIHTPEFEFEKDYDNLVGAVEKYEIEFPVVQDNDKQTWRSYKNRYWPRKYLIDIDGFIVYDHIGEGKYEETEEKIQELLKERNEVLNDDKLVESDITNIESNKGTAFGRTEEIYFGYEFDRNQIGNSQGFIPEEVVSYGIANEREKNLFYLEGRWQNNEDNMELVSDAGSIYLKYFAKNVNIVAGAEEDTKIDVYLDGEMYNSVIVNNNDLYNLVDLEESGAHEIILKSEKGLEAYTFTFG